MLSGVTAAMPPVQIQDVMLDNVAVGRIATRVYQGAACGTRTPFLIFLNGNHLAGFFNYS